MLKALAIAEEYIDKSLINEILGRWCVEKHC
jgi:hypothetical protein